MIGTKLEKEYICATSHAMLVIEQDSPSTGMSPEKKIIRNIAENDKAIATIK